MIPGWNLYALSPPARSLSGGPSSRVSSGGKSSPAPGSGLAQRATYGGGKTAARHAAETHYSDAFARVRETGYHRRDRDLKDLHARLDELRALG